MLIGVLSIYNYRYRIGLILMRSKYQCANGIVVRANQKFTWSVSLLQNHMAAA